MRLSHSTFYVAPGPDTLAFFERAFGLERRLVREGGVFDGLGAGAEGQFCSPIVG